MSDETEPIPAQPAASKTPADAWGQPISAARQDELQGYLDRWQAETDHGDRKGPFDGGPGKPGVDLTGADVGWLAERSGRGILRTVPNLHLERANLRGAHLAGANLRLAHLDQATLDEAHLEQADLTDARLAGATLVSAHLAGAILRGAHLEGAFLTAADLKGAVLGGAYLERAALHYAHLEGADLYQAHLKSATLVSTQLAGATLILADLAGAVLELAHLEGADLGGAHLERAILRGAHLEGAILGHFGQKIVQVQVGAYLERVDLTLAHLEGADLRGAWLDSKTVLSAATLDTKTRLGDIQWSGVGAVDLTQINWGAAPRLGDERGVNLRSPVANHEAAVRAYRQLAAQLRAQGLSEVADRFADRAQIRQRKLLFRQMLEDWRRPWRLPGDLVRWLFSWFLNLLAGYGYHPGRSVFWYLATIAFFAYAYFQVTHGLPLIPLGPDGFLRFGTSSSFQTLAPNEALILSVSSFHGRGFFQPLKSLSDPVAGLAAIEAVIGLLIEISFIATFTQRFFGTK